MTIGTLDLGPRPVVLAPMEDVTDIGFRLLCRQMGASMVYSEFVSSDALVRNVNRSLQKLTVCPEERPVAIQIYGRFPDAMAEAARMVEEIAHPDVIDLNFGCPVKRVAVKGAGAGLLRNVPLMLEITRAVVNAVKVPVTAKTRLGWDHNSIIIDQLAEQLQDQGIQALTVHGRTRSQMYTGQADWEPIGRLKRNPRLKIPIIGNGDIASAEDALRAFEQYGVDAVMVGRATFGRPWIFREIQERVRSEKAPQPPKGEGWELGIRNEELGINGQSGAAGVSANGLLIRSVDGTFTSVPQLHTVIDWQQDTIPSLEKINHLKSDGSPYAAIAEGMVSVPQDGVWYFRSNYSEVWIDGQKVVDNTAHWVLDGERGGRSMALQAGLHHIKVVFLGYLAGGRPYYWNSGSIRWRLQEASKYEKITPDKLFFRQ